MMSSPKTIGFLQASGLYLYVSTFAFLVTHLGGWLNMDDKPLSPLFGITLFLLTFIVSATMCGSLMFAYPYVLFYDNRRKEALHTVLWSIVWLLVFFAIFLSVTLFFAL